MNSAAEFLKQKDLFQLGELATETPHPLTRNLSDLAQNDIEAGLDVLREVDLLALQKVVPRLSEYQSLFTQVAETLQQGARIYLVGCGATGRLSLSLEFLWRSSHLHSDQVISLMAGGDVALVHSLEGFEDFPQYGARHLEQLGFKSGDLLIACTEGGETPYVIGAVEYAAEHSSRSPFFLYCNNRDLLIAKVERSRRVLQNPKIHSLCLETGPMGLTGSTRMQASTALMLMVGLALEFGADWRSAEQALQLWFDEIAERKIYELKPFVELEAAIYKQNNYTYYCAEEFAITVFTDTTERAPTFNLAPFDNPAFPSARHSLTYVSIPSAAHAPQSWQSLLARAPRPLLWPEVHPKTSAEYLLSFDFGHHVPDFRKRILSENQHFAFQIMSQGQGLSFQLGELTAHFPLISDSPLLKHLSLKMLLNMHSTLVMGRLGRFEGNLMTWLYPSNGKLVDRAARYTQILLREKGLTQFTYEQIIEAQFASKAELNPNESIVHKTIAKLSGQIR